jgi:hypothetical protein
MLVSKQQGSMSFFLAAYSLPAAYSWQKTVSMGRRPSLNQYKNKEKMLALYT